MRKLNARILAVALLLVFTQKLGLRLWMHCWFHETSTLKAAALPVVDKLHANCGCIDDFLMPLVETPATVVTVPTREVNILPAVYCPAFCVAELSFISLRGPPAVSLLS